MCPATALSRLTLLPTFNSPRFVRRNVSGAIPTLNDVVPSYSVTVRQVPSVNIVSWVRQVPLIQIESPRWTSSRMGPTSVIVAEKPLPPDSDVSMGTNADIVPRPSTKPSAAEGK